MAKVLVVTVCSVIVGEVTSFASFTVCQGLLSHKSVGVSLSDPAALRAVIGTGL